MVSPSSFGNESSGCFLLQMIPTTNNRRYASILFVRVVLQPTNRSGRTPSGAVMQDSTQHISTSAVDGKNIAIVGGGPGGLTLARLLQQSGAKVLVYERDQSRSARVQGSALDLHEGSGLAALEAAGLMEAFWANHRPDLDRLRLTDASGTVLHDHARRMSGAGKRPEIERGPLRDLLLDSLEPGTVRWDCKLESAEMQDKHGAITFRERNDSARGLRYRKRRRELSAARTGQFDPAGVRRCIARRAAGSCREGDHSGIVESSRRSSVDRSRRRKHDRHGNQA